MAGIVFLRTSKIDEIVDFYINRLGAIKWVSQPDIEILRHENLLIGFHQQEVADLDSLLTFFYPTKEEVDLMYTKLEDTSTSEPSENTKYQIYNFFANDPEGRKIEVQSFLHDLPPY